jgi:acid phosphatase (class A)
MSEQKRRQSRRSRAGSIPVVPTAVAGGLGLLLGVLGALAYSASQAPSRPRTMDTNSPAGAAALTSDPSDSSNVDTGYLALGGLQAAKLLPPPPAEGSPRDAADRQIFVATRRLKETPRWRLAQNDADQGLAATLKDFSCAVGVNLSPGSAPVTSRVIERFMNDQTAQIEPAKQLFRRQRPFEYMPGDICVPKTPELLHSPDYPSGHATWGWGVALILSEAMPSRAEAILNRGRAFGDSRIVCGVHNASSVEASRILAAAMAAQLDTSPIFQRDLGAARFELNALSGSHQTPDPAACASEAALIATPVD